MSASTSSNSTTVSTSQKARKFDAAKSNLTIEDFDPDAAKTYDFMTKDFAKNACKANTQASHRNWARKFKECMIQLKVDVSSWDINKDDVIPKHLLKDEKNCTRYLSYVWKDCDVKENLHKPNMRKAKGYLSCCAQVYGMARDICLVEGFTELTRQWNGIQRSKEYANHESTKALVISEEDEMKIINYSLVSYVNGKTVINLNDLQERVIFEFASMMGCRADEIYNIEETKVTRCKHQCGRYTTTFCD